MLTETFLSHFDAKQKHKDQKWYWEGLDAKPSHIGLVSNFGRFLCQKSWNFDPNIFDSYWWETIRNELETMWVCFRYKTKFSCLGFFLIFSTLVISIPKKVIKFWPEVFVALLYAKQRQIDPKKNAWMFWGKTRSFCGALQVWRVFMPKFIKFWLEYFRAILMQNNNKMTENDVERFGCKT